MCVSDAFQNPPHNLCGEEKSSIPSDGYKSVTCRRADVLGEVLLMALITSFHRLTEGILAAVETVSTVIFGLTSWSLGSLYSGNYSDKHQLLV